MRDTRTSDFSAIVESDPAVYAVQTKAAGPGGSLPLTPELLREAPSGDLFGWTQDVGMGWKPGELGRREFLLLSTSGGLREPDGKPIALGYHTGHWEVGLLMRAAAEELRSLGCVPFAGFCTDPCDGRTQGTAGMMDSLPYRNDAATVLRRLIRFLADAEGRRRRGDVRQGSPGDDDGAGGNARPTVRADSGRSHLAAKRWRRRRQGADNRRSLRARPANVGAGRRTGLQGVRFPGRRLPVPGHRSHFPGRRRGAGVKPASLGTGTVGPANLARHGPALGAGGGRARGAGKIHVRHILTDAALRNAMAVHAAFGGSTNLLLHIPAIAYHAGL